MKRALGLTLVMVALTVLAGCGGDGESGNGGKGGKGGNGDGAQLLNLSPDVRSYLPDGAIAAIYYNGDHPKMADTALADICNEPGMKEFFLPVWDGVRQLIRENLPAGKGKPDLLAMEPLLGTQIAVALYAVKAEPDPNSDRPARRRSDPDPAFVAVLRVGAEGSPLRQAVTDGLKHLVADMPLQTIEGVSMTPLAGGMAMYGFKDDMVILGMQPAVGRALMADEPKLTASKAFTAMSAHTDLGNEVVGLYVDAQALMAVIELSEREAVKVTPVMAALGLAQVKGASLTWAPRDKGMVTMCHVATPTEAGLMKAMVGTPIDDALLKCCPKDVGAVVAMNVDMVRVWDSLMNVVMTAEPRAAVEIKKALDQVKQRLGIDVRDDLLDSFGEGTMIAVTEGGLLLPNITLVQKLKNVDRAEKTLTKLLNVGSAFIDQQFNQHRARSGGRDAEMGAKAAPAGEPKQVQTTTYKGQKITYANFFLATPAFTIKDDYLILAASPVEIKDYIDVLAKGNLLANTDWQTSRAKLSIKKPQGVYYGDFRSAGKKLYYVLPLLAAMGTAVDQVPMKLDVGLLPGSETIAKHLFGAAGAWVVDGNGITCEVYSPIGTGVPLTSIGAAGLSSAMLLPALSGAMAAARTTQMRNDERWRVKEAARQVEEAARRVEKPAEVRRFRDTAPNTAPPPPPRNTPPVF